MQKRKYAVHKLFSLIFVSLLSHSATANDKRIRFSIISQPMNAALIEFSEQSGLQVMVNTNHIRDLKSQEVTGELATTEAISLLLQNTSLIFDVVGHNTIVIKQSLATGKDEPLSENLNNQPRASAPTNEVMAKEDEEEDKTQRRRFEKISVVGSAIANQRLESALPVAVYDHEAMDTLGILDGNELVRSIPQMGDMTWNESWIPASSNAARGDVASLNLKNLGASSTLLLINGRRSVIHPTTSTVDDNISTTTFNTNAMPLYGTERIEILLDGAAAIYGSDAIAGVVNVVTRKNIDGAGVQIKYGEAPGTNRSDTDVTGYLGRNFQGGRGNVTLTYNWFNRTPQYSADQWYTATTDHRNFLPGTDLYGSAALDKRSTYTPWGNFIAPYEIRINDQALTSSAGVFHAEPNTSERCIATGQASQCYAAGTTPETYFYDTAKDVTFVTPDVERYNLFSTFGYMMKPELELFGEAALYKAESSYQASAGFFSVNTPVYIAADAYFNPLGATYRDDGAVNPYRISGLTNVPDTGLALELKNYRFADADPRTVNVDNTQMRFLFGLKGWEGDNLNWETALLYSKGTAIDRSENYSVTAIAESLSGKSDFAYNPFNGANGSNSQATIDAFSVVTQRTSESEIASWDIKLSTQDIMPLPAGTLGFAAGFEFRYESLTDDRDPHVDGTKTYTDWYTGYEYASDLAGTSPTADSFGSRNVKSLYTEFAVPVIAPEFGIPFVHSLDMQVAGRYENYSDVGDIGTPKIAVAWWVTPDLLLRTSWSKGFKAPNLEVLNSEGMARYYSYADYLFCEAALRQGRIGSYADCNATYAVTWHISGNENLKPERSINRSAGFVYTPDFLNSKSVRFSVALDTWHISIRDRVGVPLIQEVLIQDLILRTHSERSDPRVFRHEATSDEEALFSGTGIQAIGRVSYIQADYQNLNALEAKGTDVSVDWSLIDPEYGRFSFNLAMSKLISYQQAFTPEQDEIKAAQSSGLLDPFIAVGSDDEVGIDGKKPQWKGTASLSWENKNLLYRLSAQYIHSLFDGKYASGANFKVPSTLFWNASAKYTIRNTGFDAVEAEIGVRNLFDEEPPLNASGDYLANLYLPFSRYLYASAEIHF
ncbi:MAG: TonB-dependent receptor [Alteromonadaceae bacterium]|nr:TonB-dependent receptor [Alteromonadaceae bacterium]